MLIDSKIVENYIELHDKIAKLFEDAKVEKKQFFEAIGMTRKTFNKKLQEKNFAPNELLALINEMNKVLNIK